MHQLRGVIAGTTAFFCMLCLPVAAQNVLDAEIIKLYGGTYLSDCNDAAAPKLQVTAETLVVERGAKRVVGRNVQAAHSYFGQNPPADYQVALLSEARGGTELLFIVHKDAKEQYIKLAGDKKVEAALGQLLALKFRRCNTAGSKKAVSSAPATSTSTAVATPITADSMTPPSELLKDASFKSLYYKALGTKIKESWLKKLNGPSPVLRTVSLGGTSYQVISSCKSHDCGENNLVALYSAEQNAVYGKIYQGGKTTFIGAPSAALQKELEQLWKTEWRQGQN